MSTWKGPIRIAIAPVAIGAFYGKRLVDALGGRGAIRGIEEAQERAEAAELSADLFIVQGVASGACERSELGSVIGRAARREERAVLPRGIVPYGARSRPI